MSKEPSTVALAVLPFENLSGGVEQDYFSRGFVEDLITDLARFPNLLVTASHSSFAPGARGTDEKETSARLHVEYLLKGSIRRDADKVRLTTQLVNPGDGSVVWAERYDAPQETILEIHDDIVARVVGSLSSRIDASLLAAARKKPVTELAAYDCWLRGFDEMRRGSRASDKRARELFNRAIGIDPHYARAYVGLSMSYFNAWSCQLWEAWDENERMSYDHALKASELDNDDHLAHLVLAGVLMFRREFDRAEQHALRAYALNPNDADAIVQLAMSLSLLGKNDLALECVERAMRLNPFHESWYYAFVMLVAFGCGDYAGVVEAGLKAPDGAMVDLPVHIAIAYDQLGEKNNAAEYADIFIKQFTEKITFGRTPTPGEAMRWVLYVNPYRKKSDEDRLAAGLRRLGLGDPDDEKAPLAARKDPVESQASEFRKIGDVWQMSFDGMAVSLTEVKGFVDIAVLLRRPGAEVHVSQLMGVTMDEGGGDPLIDDKARQRYEKHILELQSELAEAESHNDLARISSIQSELDQMVEHLRAALGLGGRSRRLGDLSERARSAITWRIRSAIKKIEMSHPALGRHLGNAVQTGTYCVYSPEKPHNWAL